MAIAAAREGIAKVFAEAEARPEEPLPNRQRGGYRFYYPNMSVKLSADEFAALLREFRSRGRVLDLGHQKLGPAWFEPLFILYTCGRKVSPLDSYDDDIEVACL